MQKRIEKIMFAIAVACMGVLFTSCHTSRRVTTDDIYDNSTSVPSTGDGGQTEVKAKAGDNKKLYAEVDKWLGVPYRYGGTSRSGVDCSRNRMGLLTVWANSTPVSRLVRSVR